MSALHMRTAASTSSYSILFQWKLHRGQRNAVCSSSWFAKQPQDRRPSIYPPKRPQHHVRFCCCCLCDCCWAYRDQLLNRYRRNYNVR